MGFSHRYCCVAIPLYNIGVYAILAEQFVASIVIGVLNFSAPDIVAVDIPSFGATLVGILCILTAVLQAWGFWGVFKEKPANFRLFVRAYGGLLGLTLLLPLIWIILSAARHDSVVKDCVTQFSSENSSVDGEDICNIFVWIQFGVMGLLWLIFAIAQGYFLFVLRIYGFEQRSDHAKYNSIYSAAGEDLARQSEAWDSRVSTDLQNAPHRSLASGHGRTESNMSKRSSLRNEVPAESGSLAYSYPVANEKAGYGYQDQYAQQPSFYGQQHQYQQQQQGGSQINLMDAYGGQQQQPSYEASHPQQHQQSYPPQAPSLSPTYHSTYSNFDQQQQQQQQSYGSAIAYEPAR